MNRTKNVVTSIFALLSLGTPCVITGESTSLSLQGNLTLWPNVSRGGQFQVTGYQPFRIHWLYDADPCSHPLTYNAVKSVTTATCKIRNDAGDNYVFQADPPEASSAGTGDIAYIRTVPCKGCFSLPIKKGPTTPTKKPPTSKANLTSFTVKVWCDKKQTATDPDPIEVPAGALVMWAPIGSNDWSVTLHPNNGKQACTNGSTFGSSPDQSNTCNAGNDPEKYEYQVTLNSCSTTPVTKTFRIVP